MDMVLHKIDKSHYIYWLLQNNYPGLNPLKPSRPNTRAPPAPHLADEKASLCA